MGWRCSSRLSAPPMQSAPKMKKSARYMPISGVCRYAGGWDWRPRKPHSKSLRRPIPVGVDQAGDDDVRDGEGQQKLPAEAHQLVIAEARRCAAHPDVQKDEEEGLHYKPEERQQGLEDDPVRGGEQVAEGAGPATEEEQRGHAAHRDHVGVLSHEEHGELHRAVLGVVADGTLALCLDPVEGGAVGLGIGGDQIDEEGDELKSSEDVPGDHAMGGLDIDYIAQPE